jgi:hypothetical protein
MAQYYYRFNAIARPWSDLLWTQQADRHIGQSRHDSEIEQRSSGMSDLADTYREMNCLGDRHLSVY